MAFLDALFAVMGVRRRDTLGICKLFNPKDKSEARRTLRDAWLLLGAGEPNLNNVDAAMKSLVGTAIKTGDGVYTLALVPKRTVAGIHVWAFMYGEDGDPVRRLLTALQRTMDGRAMRLSEILAEFDDEMFELAMFLSHRYGAMTKEELGWILRAYSHREVNGQMIVRSGDRRWRFVKSWKKSPGSGFSGRTEVRDNA